MSRLRRLLSGGIAFHVLNRGVGKRTLFSKSADFDAFVSMLAETLRTRPMRVCGYCLMPNHWHMLLWPEHDGEVSSFLQHLTNLHVKRWKEHHSEVGFGHLYQGRFKSFPIQNDDHFRTVIRYIERNPLRANLVDKAEHWRWSSLGQPGPYEPIELSTGPDTVARPRSDAAWINLVNVPQTESELAALRQSIRRGCPYGDADWSKEIAEQLDLSSTLRPRGRPRTDASVGGARPQ
jgi:putative transposase